MRSDSRRVTVPPSVAIFCSDLSAPGGAERVVFEEASALRRRGYHVDIVTFFFRPTVRFSDSYDSTVTVLKTAESNSVLRFASGVFGILRFLLRSRPQIVISMSAGDCARLWLPAILTRTKYITHINGTQFWFPPEEDLTKYSWLHRRSLQKVLEVSPRHEEFVPRSVAGIGPMNRLRLELSARLHWIAVRRSSQRIAFSRRMAWEIEMIYQKPALSLKGAFPASLLSYSPRSDPAAKFRIGSGPVILNVNRLDPRKRVGLVIEAFALVLREIPDAVLLIGGKGPCEVRLRALVEDLQLTERVHFLGFVDEAELADWLAGCDVFVHPNWAEFAIAPYEALAVGTNVVWSNEMEMDPELKLYPHIFPAIPDRDAMAKEVIRAAGADRATLSERAALSPYTWERYFAQLEDIIAREMGLGLT